MCVQEAVSEFISFITSEAAEYCLKEKRKTITGEDIILAMNNLGFEEWHESLCGFLKAYREHTGGFRERAVGEGGNEG